MSEEEKKEDVEEDEEKAPAPQQFQRPKWLLNLAKDKPPAGDEVELKSGAASGVPPPLEGTVAPPKTAPTARPTPVAPPRADVRVEKPQGLPPDALRQLAGPHAEDAHVRMDKPSPGPPDALKRLEAPAGEAQIRIDKPQAAAPSPEMLRRLSEAAAEAHVKIDKPAAARPALREIDPSTVHVKKPPTEAERPKPPVPAGPSQFDVVVDAHAKNPRSERLKVTKPRKTIGIVDTTFARSNMGAAALDQLEKLGGEYDVVRRTVPGIKDLAVECKILLEEEDCDLVIACGMVGGQPIDKQCAHEASLAIQWAMLATNRHILEVFVHEDEAKDEGQLAWLMDRRTREHAENAHWMLTDPAQLTARAGQGLRQGFDDAGPLQPRP